MIIQELNERLGDQEDRNSDLQKAKKKMESDCENFKKQIQDLEMALRKSESEKQSRDHQIRSLQDEMQQQVKKIPKKYCPGQLVVIF